MKKTHRHFAEQLGLVIVPVDDLTVTREKIASQQDAGWHYVDRHGDVSARRAQEIATLVIPPAWQNVRIAPNAKAHIQAVGQDAKRRLQYIYHSRWSEVREGVKALRLLRFGQALPALRKAVARDLQRPINHPKAVLATAVRLIDRQLIRVGDEEYVSDGTKGASTLSSKDVKISGENVAIAFTGKSGRRIQLNLKDPALKKRIKKLKKRNRGRLFKAGGAAKKQKVRAALINRYISKASGRKISAKDFRTFSASAQALALLCNGNKATMASVSKQVSKALHNTPAVARNSYIHPTIVKAYENSALDVALLKGRKRNGLSREETALMRFLEQTLKR